jgi:hypothetical protein
MSDIPRRSRIDLFTPAEQAIREALLAVEAAGCDERLTKAVTLLADAQAWVADFVDGVVPADHYPRYAATVLGQQFTREGAGFAVDPRGPSRSALLCLGCGKLPPHTGSETLCPACAPPNGTCSCPGCALVQPYRDRLDVIAEEARGMCAMDPTKAPANLLSLAEFAEKYAKDPVRACGVERITLAEGLAYACRRPLGHEGDHHPNPCGHDGCTGLECLRAAPPVTEEMVRGAERAEDEHLARENVRKFPNGWAAPETPATGESLRDRCSVCGSQRVPLNHSKTKFGACSLVPGSDGKGGCHDPLRDYEREQAAAPSPTCDECGGTGEVTHESALFSGLWLTNVCTKCSGVVRPGATRGDGRCRSCRHATPCGGGFTIDCGQGQGHNIDRDWGCDKWEAEA